MIFLLAFLSLIFFGLSAFFAFKFFAQTKQNALMKFENQNLNSQNLALNENLQAQVQKNENLKSELENLKNFHHNEIVNFRIDSENLKVKLHNALENLNELKAAKERDLQNLKDESAKNLELLKNEFQAQIKAQGNAILESNKLNLMQDSKAILSEIFTPIAKNVSEYSQKLKENEIELKTNIKNMFDFTQKLGRDADKLAQILKGDKKVRGDFAELQLKNVLQNSGLIEGEQYKLQEHLQLDGSAYRPDAIVYLDKQKSIVIDAKFSLPNASFADFASADNVDSQNSESNTQTIAQEIAKNLRARIDELAKKPYAALKTHSYDFVLLFIPYQNILDLALETDAQIYQYAYSKKIYLTTPHTLFMALKTIEISWRGIQSDEKVQEAFLEIGRFYDKFVGVMDNFDALKRALQSLNNQADDLENKLRSGKGNLADRFENLKTLGAKTNKAIAKRAQKIDETKIEPRLIEIAEDKAVDSENL